MQANDDDDDHDEYTWLNPPLSKTPLTTSLSSLDASLRCPICHSLFHIPVCTPCHHTFCSECIRISLREGLRGLKRSSMCPVCRTTVEERDLRPNRALDQVVSRWEGARGRLREALVGMETAGRGETAGRSGGDEEEVTVDRTTNPTLKNDDSDEIASDVSPTTTPPPPPPSSHKRKSLPYFHGMKRKKLIHLCSSESLPTHGTDKDLRDRYTEFVTLYNAECDAAHPRPRRELVAEVTKRETARKEVRWGETRSAALMERVTKGVAAAAATTEGDGAVVASSGDKKFDKKMRDSFKNLVTNYRRKVEGLPPLEDDDGVRRAKRRREEGDDDGRIDIDDDESRRISTRATRMTTRTTDDGRTMMSRSMTKREVTTTTTSLTGPWQCERCTYVNQTRIWSTAKCEMCDLKRPSLAKRRKNQSAAGAIEVDC